MSDYSTIEINNTITAILLEGVCREILTTALDYTMTSDSVLHFAKFTFQDFIMSIKCSSLGVFAELL